MNRSLLIFLAALELGSIGSIAAVPSARKQKRQDVAAAQLVFVSPISNAKVSGVTHLELTGDLSGVASVEYRFGNYRIAKQIRAPFSFDWNSAFAPDGSSQITATARDPLDRVLFTGSQAVQLQNYGNSAEIVNNPFTAPVRGSVPLTLRAFDSKHFPAYWQVFVDGEIAALRFTDQGGTKDATISQALDTTKYPNGMHEFSLAVHSNDFGNSNPPGGPIDFRAGVTQMVQFENGRTYMEPLANLLHVYATPGESIDLTCKRLYTDLESDACTAPQWTSANPAVAGVDASGTLRASGLGFTTVTLTESDRTTKVRVWVRSAPGLPHFIGNGKMSNTYVEGQSMFLIAPFLLEPELVRRDPTLLPEVKRAAVNTLGRGFYQNVSDINVSYAEWKQGFDALVVPDWTWAKQNGFAVLPTGDEVARSIGSEGWRTLNWPYGKQAVQYAIQRLAESGAAISVDMLDESTGFWGANPIPPGKLGVPHAWQSVTCAAGTCTAAWPEIGSNQFHDSVSNGLTFSVTGDPQVATPPGKTYTMTNVSDSGFVFAAATPVTGTFTSNLEFQWFARQTTCGGKPCAPPVLNDALSTISSWVRFANFPLPISWPPAGVALTSAQANWMGPGSVSDYASHYWDSNQQRRTYAFGEGNREVTNSMLTAFYDRQPYMQLDKPQLMLQTMSGMNYTKNSPAGTDGFNPPLDEIQHVGVISQAVTSGMMTAAAAGNVGLRLYQFATYYDHDDAVKQGPGGGGIQTGAGPFYGEVKNWQAMAYGANLLTKVLQPYLLATPKNSPAYGHTLVTAVREAAAGRMLMIVNASDGPRQLAVDFKPYKYGFGSVRYRVSDTGIRTLSQPDQDGETISLEAGETVAYVFPVAETNLVVAIPYIPRIAGIRTILRYGYIYSGNVEVFGEPVECTGGCQITVDPKIGDVFYQLSLSGIAQPVTAALPTRRSPRASNEAQARR